MASLAPAEKAPTGKPLKVGSPHDPAEREADRIADILTAPEEPAMPVCAACTAGGAPCAACGGGAEGGVLRRQVDGGGDGDSGGEMVAPPSVHRVLSEPGEPLPAGIRGFFEARLGHDFGGVGIHHDAESHRLNEQLGARAFTRGREIFLREGEYQPETTQGLQLLAHELVHVLQQRGGGAQSLIQRAPAPAILAGEKVNSTATTTDAEVWSQVFAAECQSFLLSLAATKDPSTNEKFKHDLAELITSLRDGHSETEKQMINSYATAVANLEQDQPPRTTKLNTPGAFHALAKGRQSGSASVGLLAFSMSRKLGVLFASGLEGLASTQLVPLATSGTQTPAPLKTPVEQINDDLTHARMALTDERTFVQLELEGTVALLIDRRRAFSDSSEVSVRKKLGTEIGAFSRQALLLNGLLQRMDLAAAQTPNDPTALDNILSARASEIDGLAKAAAYEGNALEQLGDSPAALTLQGVAVENALYPELLERSRPGVQQHGAEIRPEQAFPETLDLSENEMIRSVEERVRLQRETVARLRNAVIPTSPKYTLDEFAKVFTRWAAFFSVEQEILDPGLRSSMEMLGEPYRMMGSAALGLHPSLFGKVGMVEGAIARHILMRIAVQQMDHNLQLIDSLQPQLGRNAIGKQSRREGVDSNALNLNYRFGQLFEGSPGGPTAAGELLNRDMRSKTNREHTARAFTTTAEAVPKDEPGLLRIARANPEPERDIAVQQGIAPDADVPLVGLRKVEAREGWSSLVDIYDPMSVVKGHPIVVEREHKTLPTEVVDYLLAVEQHRATLATPHQPKYAGRVIGDAAVRGEGLEATPANSSGIYLQGGFSAPASDDANTLASTRRDAMRDMRRLGVNPTDDKADPTKALLGSMTEYFNAYFAQKDMEDTAKRVATVLVIATVQYGALDQAAEVVRPGRIAHAVADALKVHGIVSLVSSFGSMGKLVGGGISAYFSANGISDVAAIQGMLSFFMIAAEADSFSTARVRSKLVANFLSDAEQLIDSIITSAATHALDSLASRLKNPPRTPRELADFCGPMMDNPKSRKELMSGVDAHMRELESKPDFDRLQPSEEYRSMQAFREQLQARATGKPAPHNVDADLPMRRDRTEEEASNRALSRRTDAQREALKDALGPHRELPIIENPHLGNEVRIHYDGGILRMEVGPDAKPEQVRAHQNTVTQLKRYQGPMGKVRVLIGRVVAKLTGTQFDEIGSMRREAKMEVEKLSQMLGDLQAREAAVNQRAARLTADTTLAESKATQAEITRDIEGLEKQIAHYETVLNTPGSAPGRGYIASGDTTGKAIPEKLREAETASRAQSDVQKQAKADLDALHGSARDARTKKQEAKEKVAEAKELEAAFRDDPKALAEARGMRDKAVEDLKEAEKEQKAIEANVAAQRKAFETADRKYYEAREKEVDVAKEKLDLDLKGLYGQRVEAWHNQRAAEAERNAIATPLLDATAALDRVLEAHKQPPTIPAGLTKDQLITAYNAALAARRQVEQPHRDRVAQLKSEYDKANQKIAEALAKRNEATETINKRRADFEARQAEAFGIPRDVYESLRSRTPNTARTDAVKDAKVDAIYGTPIQDTPHADHIVPMFEIVRMPGFARLSDKQRMEILNDPKNFWALDGRVNSSKGHRTMREWKGHTDIDTFKPIPDAKMKELIATEDKAREHLRSRINQLAPPLTTDGP